MKAILILVLVLFVFLFGCTITDQSNGSQCIGLPGESSCENAQTLTPSDIICEKLFGSGSKYIYRYYDGEYCTYKEIAYPILTHGSAVYKIMENTR